MTGKPLTRRGFLKVAGATTAIAVPALAGYSIYHVAGGDAPPHDSPYAADDQQSPALAGLNGRVPILLLKNKASENLLGPYLEEILRAEGLNCFHMADIAEANASVIETYDILILAEGNLTADRLEMLESYVQHGGRLLCMRPDARLAPLLGVEKTAGQLAEGYIQTDADHPAAAGINSSTLQYHGEADLYKLAGATPVAWLFKDRETPAAYPALTVNHVGSGIAAMWAYDLAKSILHTRQGNPQAANQDRDGLNGIRTVDMFVDWIDLSRISIPQADEQQRLLANLLDWLSAGKRPLPRIWYFPEDKKCVLIATGDSHMNPAPFIYEMLDRVDRYNGHFTVYYAPQIVDQPGRALRRARFLFKDTFPWLDKALGDKFASPTPADIKGWRQRGHEFALHPYEEEGLEKGWDTYWAEFTGRGYGPVPPTVRTHRILWSGWVETARVQAEYGMRMNMDFYHVGPSMQDKDGKWVYGHLTGSGRPMKFMDENGRILNIYQQLTQLADEHLIPMDVPGWGGWPNLIPDQAVEVSRYLFERSVSQGDYCAIGGQFHVDPFQVGGDVAEKAAQFLEGTFRSAQELGIPIWSAQEWLSFTDARHNCVLDEMVWNNEASTLQFQMSQLPAQNFKLTIMIPNRHNEKSLSAIWVDDANAPYYTLTVGGIDYACASVDILAHKINASYG